MNTHLKQLWAAMKLPKNFKKSYKFFCLGLDIRVPEFVNTGLLIQRKTGSWFIRLSPTIPQNILSLKLSKPGSMMI